MAKKKKTVTHLTCEGCQERNYTQIVSGKRPVGSLKLTKYCSRCQKHTAHKESK